MSKNKLAGIIIGCTIVIIVAILLIIFPPGRPLTPSPTTYTLSVSVSPSGAGSVSPSGGEYESGAQVTLTASPASGYAFDNWSGDASGTEPTITVTMDSNKNITPNFVSNVSNPPIQVALDFFGIKDTHQPLASFAPNTIQLFVVVGDGKTRVDYPYPRSGEGIPMEYFQLEDLGQQRIFETSSVGDDLTISVLAYSCADKETTLSVGRALQAFESSLGPILDFYERLPQSKELIGWYEHTWGASEEWGAKQGTYEAEGSGDLRLWFRIWSNTEPASISEPLFVPDVRIEDVKLPTDARPEYPCFIPTKYPITLSLVNNEDFDVPIKWEVESSMTGNFDHGEATVPKNGKLDISKPYCWEAGERTITYTIYYYWTNAKLDTWSGSLNVTP